MDKNDTLGCAFEGCWNNRRFKNTGLCQSHQIQYRNGHELRPLQPRGVHGDRPECRAPQCDAYARTAGMCKSHYMRFRRTGRVYGPGSAKSCVFEGCNRAVDVRGYCETHYKKVRDSGEAPWSSKRMYPCRIGGCDRSGQNGMCNKHAARAGRYGLTWDQLRDFMAGGQCEACGFEGVDLDIHHDHSCCAAPGRSCGECVVAYLCSACNKAAGMLGDSPERLYALASLLEERR